MRIRTAIFMFLAASAVSISTIAANWPAATVGPEPIWEEATDPVTNSRFIPMQLIVPAVWDGKHRIDLPDAASTDTEGTIWTGPHEWRNPYTKKMLKVYERRRTTRREGAVEQKMAVRDDDSAIGRAYDSRFGQIVCAQEAKFPLGVWKEGEVRSFEYTCLSFRDDKIVELQRISRITIEKLDYEYRGITHSLRFAWQLSDGETNEVLDHRTYIFSPGRGLAAQHRR